MIVTVGGVLSTSPAKPAVISNASTTTTLPLESKFFSPVTSIASVCDVSPSDAAVNTVARTSSPGANKSTVAANVPSSQTRAMPACGPRKPVQLTPVPLKVSVALAAAAVDVAAVPPRHERCVSSYDHEPV